MPRATPPPAPSANLQTWLQDPDWPDKPRIWTPTMPAHIRRTLSELSRQAQAPTILIEINLSTGAQTTTRL